MIHIFPDHNFETLANTHIACESALEQEWFQDHVIEKVPTHFWISKQINKLPSSAFLRKKVVHEIFDLNHSQLCSNISYHDIYHENYI